MAEDTFGKLIKQTVSKEERWRLLLTLLKLLKKTNYKYRTNQYYLNHQNDLGWMKHLRKYIRDRN